MQTQTRSQPATWHDVVGFLTLASILGVFIGVALGVMALLLAAPAQGADRRRTPVNAVVGPRANAHAVFNHKPKTKHHESNH